MPRPPELSHENNRHSPKVAGAVRGWLDADFERFQNGGDDDRRQGTGINIRMRIKAQILERLSRSRDEAAERAERFRKRSVSERNAVFDAKFSAAPRRARHRPEWNALRR